MGEGKKMIKEDCLYYGKCNDMGATIHWCKSHKDIINTCDKCNEYLHKDLVQVVRCKDCRFRYQDGANFCLLGSMCMSDEWFCADGERREDEID